MLVLANGLAGFGVALLLIGHFFVSNERHLKGFTAAAAGGFLVMIGSALLESWSVVVLNLVWIGLSLEGIRMLGKEPVSNPAKAAVNGYMKTLLPITFVVGMVLMVTGYYDLSAWACTVIYLLGYWLLTTKRLTNQEYMLWTFLGFFLLLQHLVEHQSYSVLVNETIGALISLRALHRYLTNNEKSDLVSGSDG